MLDAEIEKLCNRGKKRPGQACMQVNGHAGRWAGRQAGRQTDRQADRQADRQTDRQSVRKTDKNYK